MACSPEELSDLTAKLTEAKKAYHQLMLGGAVVRVQDQSGEAVTYTTANASRLKIYIAQLEAEIRAGCGGISGGPIRPMFL